MAVAKNNFGMMRRLRYTFHQLSPASSMLRTWYWPVIWGIVALMLLEGFLFNLPFWQTLNSSPKPAVIASLGSGLEKKDEHSAIVTDQQSAWLDIKSTDVIDYVYINPSVGDENVDQVKWTMSTKKAGDGGWYEATADAGYSTHVDDSRYLHVSGLSKQVRFNFKVNKGDIIPLSDITINPHVPFRIDIVRVFFEIIVLTVFLAIRPHSVLYTVPFSVRSLRSVLPVIYFALVGCIALIWFWYESGGLNAPGGLNRMTNGSYFDADQYAHMADALIHGHVYLDIPVDPGLAAMDNPYDAASRIALSQHSDLPILFDTAFKDGRYYSYFGVLPTVLLFVPYQLLTGHYLSASHAVIFLGIMAFLANILLCVQLGRVFGRRRTLSTGVVTLAIICSFLASGVAHNIQVGLFYQIPQTSALLFVELAYACWIEAKLNSLNKIWLACGSFSAAMIIGCRPQFVLALLVAFPLFWNELIDLWNEGVRSRAGLLREIGTWASVLLPFICGFLPFGIYNYVRFGSLIDFGANYNLTGYDMTHHQLPLTLMLPLIFLYFFQPSNISTVFPFMGHTQSPMPLWIPMQPSYGGFFFFLAPFAFVLLFHRLWGKALKRCKLFGVCVAFLMYAVVVFAFDAHIVGYDLRYMLDFGWALGFALVLALFSIDTGRKGSFALDRQRGGLHLTEFNALSMTVLSIVCGFVILAIIMLYFKQFIGASIIHEIWWKTESWFLFI